MLSKVDISHSRRPDVGTGCAGRNDSAGNSDLIVTENHNESTTHRYILLGASNLTISFPLLLQNLCRDEQSPAEIRAALGHGRSFIGWSRVLWRGLPGIVECGLWDESDRPADDRPNRALITDVGNDLLYGYPVEEIIATVTDCLKRLQQIGADIVLTLPPLAAVRKLSRWRFSLVRRVMFPSCRLSFQEVLAAAHSLEEQLADLGQAYRLPVITPPGEWYGLDPIHIRRRCRSDAWRTIFSAWSNSDFDGWNLNTSTAWIKAFRHSRPAEYQWRNREIRVPQPTVQTPTGTLSLY